MRGRAFLGCAVVALVPALVSAAPRAPAPPDPMTLTLGLENITLWPFTGEDYTGARKDPVNLLFLDTDPREVRQALFALDGNRPPFPAVFPFNCSWHDAMGYEQVGWADLAGWTGSEVQLACGPYGPFRVHLRLFRQGPHTLGAAHFEFLIPDTTEHEVLGWELPRDIVTVDMVRTGALVAPPAPAMLVDVGGHYRDIRPPVFNALVGVADLHPLLTVLELPLTPQAAPVPIPFDGVAMVFRAAIAPDPVQAHLFDALTINFNQVIEKPFCNGPTDYVLVQGPVRLVLNVHTNPSGFFSRTYDVGANLRVTPFNPVTRMPTGPTVPAVVTEWHRAQLTNRYGELREIQNRQLLGATPQTFFSDLASGKRDGYIKEIVCGATP